MTAQKQRRLGRGLSSLIGPQEPIQVEPTPVRKPDISTTSRGATKDFAGSPTSLEGSERETGEAVESNHRGTGGIRLVAVGDIEPSRFQPRRQFDAMALSQLAASLKRSGLMQPIIVRPTEEHGGYELVAGERRWRAAQLAGMEAVPALVRELEDAEAAEWALVENIQREDLNPVERAHGLRSLAERFGLSHAEVGLRVGLERSTVANLIRLTELEEPIQALVVEGKLAMGHARAVLAMPSGEARIKLARRAAMEGWTVRQVEQAARDEAPTTQDEGGQSPQTHNTQTQREAVIADLERRLSDHLGTKTKIVLHNSGNRGRIQVEFFSLEQFEGLMEQMGLSDEEKA